MVIILILILIILDKITNYPLKGKLKVWFPVDQGKAKMKTA